MNFCQASHLTLFIIAWSISFVNRFFEIFISFSAIILSYTHLKISSQSTLPMSDLCEISNFLTIA